MVSVIVLAGFVAFASASTLGPCYYDGHEYAVNETITIPHCLATMTCLGDNNYGNVVSLGGVCPDKRETDGQSGCLYDGTVYGVGDKIIIQPCLAEMTCLGNNVLSDPVAVSDSC
ncbi:uncharacterized protein LOC128213942 [Mya arenaria]|uniref:uncharacterized protein LOC128213942 n=1 Tax=Mya arenaria TaxID=6604 RepID=UPI0022E348C6|nr:uncharacterized protein LOC128213942 [Mya arenaria]